MTEITVWVAPDGGVWAPVPRIGAWVRVDDPHGDQDNPPATAPAGSVQTPLSGLSLAQVRRVARSSSLWAEEWEVAQMEPGSADQMAIVEAVTEMGGRIGQAARDVDPGDGAPGLTELVNLTPHPVTVIGYSYAPRGPVLRCNMEATALPPLVMRGGQEIPVDIVRPGVVDGLPAPTAGVAYVVSRLVAEACPERRDLYIPHMLERDAGGGVIGAKGLAQVPPPT